MRSNIIWRHKNVFILRQIIKTASSLTKLDYVSYKLAHTYRY